MTATHCPYCALQCAMTLTPSPGGPVPVEVRGRDFPTNRGGLCRKGWTSAGLLTAPGRLTSPLVRGPDGELRPATWDEALDRIASEVRRLQDEHGPDAIGVFGGGGLTNEKAYQLGKFARVALGTSRIDYNGRFCMSSAAAASSRAFGLDRGLPFPVADLDTAETVLLLGSNVADTMPPFVAHLMGARGRGGLIVVDPRRSSTAKLTDDGAGRHLQPVPGTDLALLLGLAHAVLSERLHDTAYLERRTTGIRELRRSLAPWWPERVQAVTGVPAADVRAVARQLAASRSTYVLTGRGVEQHADGTDTSTAAINLALLLGLPGTPGNGYGTLTGQGNGQGGREHGQKADQLPGYRRITDPDARRHVAGVWGVDPERLPGPGIPAVQLLQSAGRPGGVRALLVHGSNVVVSAPNVRAVRNALARLDLLVVCDFFLSETAELADIVLPVEQWAEEEGTMTNLEGRVLRRRRAVTAPDGVRSELWIMAELARRLGAPGTWSLDAAEVFDELARASAGGAADYSGLSHAHLDAELGDELDFDLDIGGGEEGGPATAPESAMSPAAPLPSATSPAAASRVTTSPGAVPPSAHWPYADASTPRLFLDRFAHPDGRARLVPVAPADRPAARGAELTLVTGRLLGHYQSGTQTRRVAELVETDPELVAQVHPATALDRGIAEGGMLRLANDRGAVVARVSLSSDIRPDTVFLPFHFPGDASANLLTADRLDPVSSMPEFKTAIVTAEVVTEQPAAPAATLASAERLA